jgi:MFS superfamily sulfate permease-like transporter
VAACRKAKRTASVDALGRPAPKGMDHASHSRMSENTRSGMVRTFLSPVTDEPVSYGRELLASVVVFLVALPLCMGIAIASGVPPALGLITGVVGGLVVGSVGGASLLVSGPAAGLAVLVWQCVQDFGLERLGFVVLGAGVIQLTCGICRLGRWFRAVSPAVIQGMLAGIGILILSSQFHVMVDDAPRDAGWKNLISIPEAIQKGVVSQAGAPQHQLAAGIGMLTLVVLVGWNVWRPRPLRAVPGPLVAVVAATALQAVLGWDIKHVSVPGNLLGALTIPAFGELRALLDWRLAGEALTFAVIASAETLLSAAAVDKLHGGARSNFDRELAAQGVGNAICGVLGALPMTGVIVRSTANVESGARTRLSTVLHGAWLLAFVLALPFVLQMIPVASLAAVLVYTGYKLVNVAAARDLYRAGRGELMVYLVTAIAIVGTDLLIGVLSGLGAAVFKLLWHFARLDVVVKDDATQQRTDMRLFGGATFVQLPKLAEALERVPVGWTVHISLSSVAYIDHACLDLLRNFERSRREAGATVLIDWSEPVARRANRPLAEVGHAAEAKSTRPEASAPAALWED